MVFEKNMFVCRLYHFLYCITYLQLTSTNCNLSIAILKTNIQLNNCDDKHYKYNSHLLVLFLK